MHRVLHQDSGFKCRVCSNTFDRLTYLRRHIASAHPMARDDEKQYDIVCNLCDKKFARPDNLMRHMMTHSGDIKLEDVENFVCVQCGLTFRNGKELVAHGICSGTSDAVTTVEKPAPAQRSDETQDEAKIE